MIDIIRIMAKANNTYDRRIFFRVSRSCVYCARLSLIAGAYVRLYTLWSDHLRDTLSVYYYILL